MPYIDDDEGTRIARRLDTGKAEYVPGNMKYKEWREKFVDNKIEYAGVPDDWAKSKSTMSMRNINALNRRDNCVNCTAAYELHRRGYPNVVSGEADDY